LRAKLVWRKAQDLKVLVAKLRVQFVQFSVVLLSATYQDRIGIEVRFQYKARVSRSASNDC
jgi:hypothetical protein